MEKCPEARPGIISDNGPRLVSGYVGHYNNVRLNSATGYITPKDMLARRQQEIHAERDGKLEAPGKCGRIAANKLPEVQRRQPTGVRC
jgi:hypothetical protein